MSTGLDHWLDTIERWLRWLVISTLVIIPFIWSPVFSELFQLPKMLVVYTTASLALPLLTTWHIITKQNILKWPTITTWGWWLMITVVTTAFSIHAYTSIHGFYSRFHGGVLSVAAYLVLLLSTAVAFQPRQLRGLLVTMLVIGFAISLYAIPEHFGGSFSCVLVEGRFSTDCWIQDVQHRIFGSFGQPNWLASFVAMLVPVAVGFGLTSSSKRQSRLNWTRLGVSGLIVLLVLTVLYTKSRSGFVGLVGGLVMVSLGWLLIKQRAVFSKQLRATTTWLLATLATILTVFVLLGTPFSPQWWSTTTQTEVAAPQQSTPTASLNPDNSGTHSGKIRLIVWQGAIDIFKRYPVFGSGPATFAYSYFQHRPVAHNLVSEWDFLYNKAHSELLHIAATMGVVGVIGYLAVGVSLMFWITRSIISPKTTDTQRVLLLCVGTSLLVGQLISMVGFSTVAMTSLGAVLAGILIVLFKPQSKHRAPEPVWWQLIPIVSSGLVSVWLLLSILSLTRADLLYARGQSLVATDQLVAAQQALTLAHQIRPNQAEYLDELSKAAVQLSLLLAALGQQESAASQAKSALEISNQALEVNPVYASLYKSQARLLISLSQLDQLYLNLAEETLLSAYELAPTDPRISYSLGLIYQSAKLYEEAIKWLNQAIDLKPDYQPALTQRAEVLELQRQAIQSGST